MQPKGEQSVQPVDYQPGDDIINSNHMEQSEMSQQDATAPQNYNSAPSPIGVPFDLASLRLSQNFAETAGVKKLITTVPVRKPHRQEFIRVHPDPTWRFETAALEVQEDRGKTAYLVSPGLWAELPGEIVPMILFTAVTRQGVVFLWPVRLPGADGKQNEWHRSAQEAAQHAMSKWVRVAANQPLGAYEVFVASGSIPEPTWPEEGFERLVQTAFRDKFIQDWDHAVLRQLRGEI
jgi:hypothetical protein